MHLVTHDRAWVCLSVANTYFERVSPRFTKRRKTKKKTRWNIFTLVAYWSVENIEINISNGNYKSIIQLKMWSRHSLVIVFITLFGYSNVFQYQWLSHIIIEGKRSLCGVQSIQIISLIIYRNMYLFFLKFFPSSYCTSLRLRMYLII